MTSRFFAYLVVVCDKNTNAIKRSCIWSSPEWEQSRCLEDRTFVAYRVSGDSFQNAHDMLLRSIKQQHSRYQYLLKYLEESGGTP